MKMRVSGLLVVFILSVGLTSGQNLMQSPPALTPATKCAVAAYVIDRDPKGLNIRSGPGTKFPILAKLPTETKEGDYEMVELWVTGISEGWAHFEKAASNNTELNLYSGKGWVFAQMLGVDAADRSNGGRPVKVYREPMTSSPQAGEVAQQTTLKLIGCRGEWAQVEYRGLKGWLPPESRERFVIKTPNKE